MMPSDELPVVAEGFAKMSVFVRPRASARNCRLNRSRMAKVRKRLPFKLKRPGPRRMSRPLLPNVGVALYLRIQHAGLPRMRGSYLGYGEAGRAPTGHRAAHSAGSRRPIAGGRGIRGGRSG